MRTEVVQDPDINVVCQGNVYQFFIVSQDAMEWVEGNLSLEGWQWMGKGSFCVDKHYVDEIVVGLTNDGLVVGGYQ